MKNQAREVGTVLNATETEQVSGGVAMLMLTPLVLTPIAAQPLTVLPAAGTPWLLTVIPALAAIPMAVLVAKMLVWK